MRGKGRGGEGGEGEDGKEERERERKKRGKGRGRGERLEPARGSLQDTKNVPLIIPSLTSSFLWYTLVPCCFWAVAANAASFSLYRLAARLLYLACASFVLQPCWRK